MYSITKLMDKMNANGSSAKLAQEQGAQSETWKISKHPKILI